jgi:hypothetical protein
MQLSEMFLMAWATVATILAVYFNYQASMRGKLLLVLTLGMRHLAEGKAEISMQDGEIKLKKVEEANATTK